MSVVPSIETRGLSRRYGAVEAVADLDLTMQGPGVFGFLGANGAGKTTTLRMLAGLIRPSAGEIRLLGRPLDRRLRRDVGYLAQEPAFYPWMTGVEFLGHVGDLLGLPRRDSRRRAEALLQRCGLEEPAWRRRIGGWSGGMKQRLGIAQALMGHPRLVLLDEPVSALDPVGRAEILELIRELGAEITVFMSTHILADVERVCREVAILHRGRLVTHEPTRALTERAVRPKVTLAVRGDPTALVTRLRAEAAVEGVELADAAGPGDATDVRQLEVTLRDPEAAERLLPRRVAEAGLGLLALTPTRPTLEEVFMRLIGRSAAEAEAAVS